MLVKSNFDLSDYNSYRIKAICKTAYFPEAEEDLVEIFSTEKEGLIVIGGGYNLLLSKQQYDNPFLIFSDSFSKTTLSGDTIEAEAGASMLSLSELAYEHSLKGLEIFYDIPSSLGGAIVMNAGAGGEEIKDMLVKVRYFDPNSLTFNEITKEDIKFEYRNSFFQRNPHLIISKVWLQMPYGEKEAIGQKMQDVKAARWAKQPRTYPNAGSVFKRPPGRFVGPMIDELGLKGYTVGGAQVSEKHSGFIINTGTATGEDVVGLIRFVKQKVFEKFGVDLEVEQRII